MSVLIKGMDMPISCWACPFFHTSLHHIGNDELLERYACLRTGERTEELFNGRMASCPLVPVPTPHGRLIDADELETDTEYDIYLDDFISYSKEQIKFAHTIIEAEGEGE